jgi:hypothetical protein
MAYAQLPPGQPFGRNFVISRALQVAGFLWSASVQDDCLINSRI